MTLFLTAATSLFTVAATRTGTVPQLPDATAAKASILRTAAVDDWQPSAPVKFTEDIIASLFNDAIPVSFDVETQQSESTPGLYRLVNPYRNYPLSISGLKYDTEGEYELILHAEDPDAVWFETFRTGMISEKDGNNMVTATTYVQLYVNAGYTPEELHSIVPDMFGKLSSDGVVTFNKTFVLLDETAYSILAQIGDDNPNSYYIANQSGQMSFEFASPWEDAGTATYTDDTFTTMFGTLPVQTYEVQVERNQNNPALLRVVNPFAPLNTEGTPLVYDSSENHYMVIHTEHAPAIWIEDFKTGMSTSDGDITFASDACYFTKKYGFDESYAATPDMYGKLNGKTITYGITYAADGDDWPCLYLEYGDGFSTAIANGHGAFCLVLPEISAPSDPDWKSIGTGTYTDDILTALAPEAGCQTYDVEIEQNIKDEQTFRIVNPYASWKAPEGFGPIYDSMPHYLVFHRVLSDDGTGYFWFDDFSTGFTDAENGSVIVTSEVQNMAGMMGIEDTYAYYPEIFGVCSDNGNTLTYPASYKVGSSDYAVIYITYSEDDWSQIDANTSGKFKITMPGATTGIGSVRTDTEEVEYFNLQGMRVNCPAKGIFIRRQGGKATKVSVK